MSQIISEIGGRGSEILKGGVGGLKISLTPILFEWNSLKRGSYLARDMFDCILQARWHHLKLS